MQCPHRAVPHRRYSELEVSRWLSELECIATVGDFTHAIAISQWLYFLRPEFSSIRCQLRAFDCLDYPSLCFTAKALPLDE
jgi:hypothetical protein